METKPQRLNYVDMMKGIATIEVICYHLFAPSSFKNSVIDHLLFPLLVSFSSFPDISTNRENAASWRIRQPVQKHC